jgi:hypothetical protein
MKLSTTIAAYLLLSLPVFTIITSMNSETRKITTNATLSEDVESRITSLQSSISSLNDEANRWNGRYIRSLTAALLIGLWTLVCQFSAIQRSRLVSDAQSELLHVKDIKAANDSRDKDLRIGEANNLAGEANERAGVANKEAGNANKEAGKANERAAQLEVDAGNLKKQNLETEARLEQERKTRLELEQFIAPREIGISVVGKETSIDSLKNLAGTRVMIDCIDEGEPRRAAGMLAFVLNSAGFNIVDVRPFIGGNVEDGVTISVLYASPRISMEAYAAASKLMQAADELSEFLEANNWDAESKWVKEMPNIPPGVIRISVGMKPNTYFMSQGLKDLRNRHRERKKALREHLDDLKRRAIGGK